MTAPPAQPTRSEPDARPARRRRRGFVPGAGAVQGSIRKALEKRGFSELRLLTRWDQIVGDEIAAMARPVRVRYGGKGMGATLVLATRGAVAPLVEAQRQQIIDRVNAVHGHAAISRIHLVQTAPEALPPAGLAEAPAPWRAGGADAGTGPAPAPPDLDPDAVAELRQAVAGVKSDALRAALDRLGQNIITRRQRHMQTGRKG